MSSHVCRAWHKAGAPQGGADRIAPSTHGAWLTAGSLKMAGLHVITELSGQGAVCLLRWWGGRGWSLFSHLTHPLHQASSPLRRRILVLSFGV